MLEKSPIIGAEEWAIHDYEEFGEISLDEYENLETVSGIALFLEEHGVIGADLLAHHCNNLEEATQAMEEYCGCYDSERDYAKELMESCYDIPDHLVNYIDYDAFARDIFICDYYSIKCGGSLHVFRTL